MQLCMLESQGDPHTQMESPFSALSILPHRFQPLSTQIFFSMQQYYHAFLRVFLFGQQILLFLFFILLFGCTGVRCFVQAFSGFGEQGLL